MKVRLAFCAAVLAGCLSGAAAAAVVGYKAGAGWDYLPFPYDSPFLQDSSTDSGLTTASASLPTPPTPADGTLTMGADALATGASLQTQASMSYSGLGGEVQFMTASASATRTDQLRVEGGGGAGVYLIPVFHLDGLLQTGSTDGVSEGPIARVRLAAAMGLGPDIELFSDAVPLSPARPGMLIGSVTIDQRVAGVSIPVTTGVDFDLALTLTSMVDRQTPGNGASSGSSDFYATALLLGFMPVDDQGQLLSGITLTDKAGNDLSSLLIPEPAGVTLLAAGLLAMLPRRR